MKKKKVLTAPNKAKLRKASREFPEKYFVNLSASVKGIGWIAKSNSYRANCLSVYDKHTKSNPARVNDGDVSRYVSASAPAHVIDGWSFVGRAVDAALRGDASSAVFFAYYAELRAAMALLASEGLGIFGVKHPILLHGGNTDVLKGVGTHDLAWLALNHWAGLQKSSALINGLIVPSGMTLSSWLLNLAPSTSVRALTDQWLSLWGLDLGVVLDDHDLRNNSSYRPSQFRNPHPIMAAEGLNLVRDMWGLLEPSRGDRFPRLARTLLKRALRMAGVGSVAQQELEFLNVGAERELEWATYLSSPEDSLTLKHAAEVSGIESATCHLEVLSRSLLLLTVATEASRRLLAAGQLDQSDLKFWWAAHGENRGLWNAQDIPQDPQDVWRDVADALQDASDWQAGVPANHSVRDMRVALAKPLNVLGSFEVAGVWGLLP